MSTETPSSTLVPGISPDPNKPGLIETQYGLLDPNPSPGEPTLSRNYGRGPGYVLFNLRLTKLFKFGRTPASAATQSGGQRRAHQRTPATLFRSPLLCETSLT